MNIKKSDVNVIEMNESRERWSGNERRNPPTHAGPMKRVLPSSVSQVDVPGKFRQVR
jgi:hypothetical protein